MTVNVPEATGGGSGVPVTAGLVAAYEEGRDRPRRRQLVTGWSDASGRGNDLVADGDPTLSPARRPTGRSAIAFDGTGDLLQRVNATDTLNGLPGGNADRTMFFVVKYIDAEGVSSGLVYGDGAKNQAFGLTTKYNDQDLTLQGWGGSNDFDSNVDGPTQGWMVQSVVLRERHVQPLPRRHADRQRHPHLRHRPAEADHRRRDRGLGESELEVGAALIYDRALTASRAAAGRGLPADEVHRRRGSEPAGGGQRRHLRRRPRARR